MSKKSLSQSFREALEKATGDQVKEVALSAIAALEALESQPDQSQEILDLRKQVDTATAIILEQSGQIQKAKLENPNYRPVVEFKKKSYRVNHPINHEKFGILSIEQIAANTEVVGELVKSQSSAISELTEEELKDQ